ncbi:hypothetical protein [Actinomadura alba]|uniref:hypothetical protein n=1 Tax=Actinomadura alba TaxID=406431 RepID=UPI001C9CC37E|nr:hypothetical protein [Actinomadura alba]
MTTTTTRSPRSGRGGAEDTKAAKPSAGTRPAPASPSRPSTRPKASPPSREATRTGGAQPARAQSPRTARVRSIQTAPPRAPFVLLVVGLLGGALVSLLLLNTVLAEDAFTLTKLQRSNKQLNQQRQALQEEIAREEAPERLAQKAKALGMVQPTRPAFVDEQARRVIGARVRPVPHPAAAAAGAAGVVAVPGAVVPGDGVTARGEPAEPVRPGAPEGGRR